MKLSIVSYLDSESSKKVRAIQRELSNITGSVGALTSWEPHITVGDGIETDEEQLMKLKDCIRSLSSQSSPFKLSLKGTGSLDNWKGGSGETTYVIYLKVVLTDELVKIVNEIKQATKQYNTWYLMPQPYLPHCTLAFRDLTIDGYKKGIKYLEQLNPKISATINHIALVEKLPDVDHELIRFMIAA